ncbi:MAG: BCCT family transporter [Rhodobacteraceae bacterium]|jgi:choline/glycine/proline betaine transport protein|uniref:Choline/carnitine/betaine transport n=2 Tax=Alphaproteobacteria TaxID=28211 RepID=A0A1U7D2B3_9RHOB|nr:MULTISPECIES: BCCT family transporter [Salipiger]MAB05574.1 BCCT family transporter [Paracoccaceae bacterium]HAE51605.1 BCCT family transporter [Tistrella mobilis]APX22289.1 choline/carnitine/betaine transport [Salipiger profundus]SFD68053.1 choline/carnitine/betaine transport [Salipiger profundus]GGA22106.1 multidrug DMT transporter permease [Salipiger profundus]
MDQLARRLGLRTNATIFFSASAFMVVFLAALLLAPSIIGAFFESGREWVVTNLGWFFIAGVNIWLAFLVWIACSRHGHIILGKTDTKPDFDNLSWFTMLFAGGIGTVLMFWGVAEPMSHFSEPPRETVEPYSIAAAEDAMSFALYHLGLHTWTIFTLPGLAFAYFIHRYDLPVRVSSVFYPLLRDRIYGPIGKMIDVAAILGTLFGVAVSLGLGSSQIAAGLSELTGLDNTTWMRISIIAVLTGVAVGSIIAGLDSGVKLLSNINIGMAVGLLVFVLVTGSTLFLLRGIVQTLGLYLGNLPQLAFWNDMLAYAHESGDGWGWQGSWTVFYWAWTVTWSPFIGLFVARISRGRTIREFVLGVLLAPSAFTLVWFAIFGWQAMQIDGIGETARAAMGDEAGALSRAVADSVPLAMFAFFEHFPFTTLIQGLAVVIVAIFFATSSDSASLVVDMLCTGEETPGPWPQRVYWGMAEGVIAGMLIWLAGDEGLNALQQVITVIGLPIFILVSLMIPSILKGLKAEEIDYVEIKDSPELDNI